MTRVATGTAKWLNQTGTLANVKAGTALLRIATNTQKGIVTGDYQVKAWKDAYTLEKEGVKYLVRGNYCSCPDGDKGNVCKHVRALAVALPKLV